MTDRLGDRLVLGVIIPSVNSTVQPEFEALRPSGVTNQTARFAIPDLAKYDADSADRAASDIATAIASAMDVVLACEPDAVALAYSTEYLVGGRAGASAIQDAVAARAGGVPVTGATFAVPRALALFGARRVGVVTPYSPPRNANVQAFFEEGGYAVETVAGARRTPNTSAAATRSDDIRAAFAAVDGDNVDALVHVGSNLPVMDICVDLEARLGKPVFGANQATYWAALRDNGLDDRLEGMGRLLAEF